MDGGHLIRHQHEAMQEFTPFCVSPGFGSVEIFNALKQNQLFSCISDFNRNHKDKPPGLQKCATLQLG